MLKHKKRNTINRIIEENIDYLYRFAFYRVGNKEEAEDIVYEAILKCLEKMPSDIKAESVRLYLFRIVHNLCNDKYRTHRIEKELIETVEIIDDIIEVNEYEDFGKINKYLENLEPHEADIIRMNVIDDLSFVEISKVLSIPQSTAKSRFKSGMDKLRKLFTDKQMS